MNPEDFENIDFYGTNNGSNPFVPADVVNTVNGNVSTSVNKEFLLTTGKWRFTVRNAQGNFNKVFTPVQDAVQFVDEKGNFVSKRYSVDAIAYNVETKKATIDISIYENPIPVLVIWGAVIAVSAIVVALSASCVLEKVEKVFVDVSAEVKSNPLIWLVIIAVALPIIFKFIPHKEY
jgi:hypothetical protein